LHSTEKRCRLGFAARPRRRRRRLVAIAGVVLAAIAIPDGVLMGDNRPQSEAVINSYRDAGYVSFKPDDATTPEPDLAISRPETNAYLAMLRDYSSEVVLDQHEGDYEDLPIILTPPTGAPATGATLPRLSRSGRT
jgi:hypothetical protein